MKDHTKIVCVLDCSGSMRTIIDDSIGGFNSFIEQQKELGDNADVSIYLFDDKHETLYENKPIKEVALLTKNDYFPRGTTALYDAVGKAINSVGYQLKETPEDQRPDSVLFVILTDGAENSSKEFTQDVVFSLISHQREKYNWQFMYLAADEQGLQDGMSMGIMAKDSVQFRADALGTKAAYFTINNTVKEYRTTKNFKVK